MLQPQKLEYTDFSAGISENTVPGKPNAYARADNLLITRDKHLQTRPGSQALSDTLYVTPGLYVRVGGLYNFYNDLALLAHTAKDFYYPSAGSWATLLGPTGNHAFNSNSSTSKVASAQWRQHLYLCSDSGDIPQVFYYDSGGTAQLRSLGLPRPLLTSVYTAGQQLTTAIALAIALKAKMLTHYGDTASHLVADSGAVTALTALVNPATLPALITYVGVLKTYYDLHITDAQASLAGQTFHIQKNSGPGGAVLNGRFAVLNVLSSTALATATDLPTVIAVLNDMRNRYNLHTWATLTHKDAVTALISGGTYTTASSGYGKNICTTAAVALNATTTGGTTVYNPVVTGQFSSLLAYINEVKKEFNAHIASAVVHNNADTDNTIVAADATDYFTAVVLLAHLEFFYWWHYQDASQNEQGVAQSFTHFVGTAASGSATFTSTSINGSGFVGQYFVNVTGASSWAAWVQGSWFGAPLAAVTSGTATTVVFGQTATSSATQTFRISTSKYHYDLDPGNGSGTNPAAYFARVSAYDYFLQDLTLLQASTLTILGLIKSHEISELVLFTTVAGYPAYKLGSGQTVNLYSTHDTGVFNRTSWPQSPPLDPATGFLMDPTTALAYMSNPPTVGSVLYTFVWRYNYTAGPISFENDSTPALLSQFYVTNSNRNPLPLTTAQYPISLSQLPVLANTAGQNWDTSNLSLDIYRTIADGTSFFLVGTVTNGTTTFSDTVVDDDLLTKEPLYTTGGVLQNDQPPVSRFITVMNNTAYYGYCTDLTSGDVFPNRILQSIPSAPYAVPAANFDDLDDELVGLSNYNNYVIAFCKTKIYRMEGSFDELGNGLLGHQMISPTIGGISHSSIVQTEYGIFFCGTNGIYWTDGFTLTRVTGELENTYNALIATATQRRLINGVYDKLTRRVYWTFSQSGSECTVGYVLDLNWGLSDRMSFTTISGANFSPSALVVYAGQIIRGESYGFVFKHDPIYASDQTPLLAQVSVPSTDWSPQAILYDFQSCATDFGSAQFKKWVTRVDYQGRALSDLFLQINRKNGNGGSWFPTQLIREISPAGMIDTFRRMPAGSLRCDYMAIQMTNGAGIVAGSDAYGVVSTGALSAGAVVLTLPIAHSFPLWSTLYTISFQNDKYVRQYTVSARTAQTLTVLDPGAHAPASQNNVLWQLRGVPYGQTFNLTAYNVTWALLSDEKKAYHGATSSDGGANTT